MAWNNGISFRLPWYPSAKLFSDRLIPTTIHTSLLEGVCLTCFTLLYLSNSEVSAHQPVNPSNSRTRLLEDGVISIRLLRCYDLLYLAIWLYIHEIYIYIYIHTYTLIWPFITLSLPGAQSLYHIKKAVSLHLLWSDPLPFGIHPAGRSLARIVALGFVIQL